MPGPPPASLTARDLEILDAFQELVRETGLPPTVRELSARLGLRSPQSVQRHLDRLVSAGRLQRSSSRRLRALTSPGRQRRQMPRTVPVVDNPWKRPEAGAPRVPLPEPDLVESGEPIIAMRSPTSLVEGPQQDDLLYCVPDRAPASGDVVVVIDSNERITVQRWQQRRTPKMVADAAANPVVVVAWTHRVVRRS